MCNVRKAPRRMKNTRNTSCFFKKTKLTFMLANFRLACLDSGLLKCATKQTLKNKKWSQCSMPRKNWILCALFNIILYKEFEHSLILVSMTDAETNPAWVPRDDQSFVEIKSYMQIFGCMKVAVPNQCLVQRSTVISSGSNEVGLRIAALLIRLVAILVRWGINREDQYNNDCIWLFL